VGVGLFFVYFFFFVVYGRGCGVCFFSPPPPIVGFIGGGGVFFVLIYFLALVFGGKSCFVLDFMFFLCWWRGGGVGGTHLRVFVVFVNYFGFRGLVGVFYDGVGSPLKFFFLYVFRHFQKVWGGWRFLRGGGGGGTLCGLCGGFFIVCSFDFFVFPGNPKRGGFGG